jgi:hypothetical protein
MALPADMHEQLEQAEARLHLLPADEAPPAEEVRNQVERWQEHVQEAAQAIRRADDVIEQLAGMPDVAAAKRDGVLAMARSVRAAAFAVMQRLNPDQGWFWTEEWQAGERECDRELASGMPRAVYYTDGELEAALEGPRPVAIPPTA